MEMKKKELILKKIKKFRHKEIIVFSLIMLILYLSTMSCSLDDGDSVNFALALKEYDLYKGQPHPPGFPVYIFIGRIFYFLIGDELLALTTLSAFAGALSLVVFYFLIFEMFDKKTALMATMILGVTPLFWLNSLMVMSDIVGLLFALISMYLFFICLKYNNYKILYFASFISAISVGVRFHTLFILLPLLIYSLVKFKGARTKLLAISIFVLGIAAWFLPLVIDTGGISGLFEVFNRQFSSRFDSPRSYIFGNYFGLDYVAERIFSFGHYLLISGYGIGKSIWFILPITLGFILLCFSFVKHSRKSLLFFSIALVPYSLVVFAFLLPSNPRYLLPIFLFLSLSFALSFSLVKKYDYLLFFILFSILIIQSVPLAYGIHTIKSPTAEVIDYINDNFQTENVTVFSLFRHSIYLNKPHLMKLPDSIDLGLNETIIIVTVDPPSKMDPFNIASHKEFIRDERIHTKSNEAYIYIIN